MTSPASLVTSLAGGVLIGIAIAILLFFDGRVAGVSGIVAGAVRSAGGDDRRWRVLFLAALVAGGIAATITYPHAIGTMVAPWPILAVAGLLVGFGTRRAGGCTSGHGVCGVSRGSARSIVATGTFMVVAALVVGVVRHAGGAP